jgi:hypothetical protein
MDIESFMMHIKKKQPHGEIMKLFAWRWLWNYSSNIIFLNLYYEKSCSYL